MHQTNIDFHGSDKYNYIFSLALYYNLTLLSTNKQNVILKYTRTTI